MERVAIARSPSEAFTGVGVQRRILYQIRKGLSDEDIRVVASEIRVSLVNDHPEFFVSIPKLARLFLGKALYGKLSEICRYLETNDVIPVIVKQNKRSHSYYILTQQLDKAFVAFWNFSF